MSIINHCIIAKSNAYASKWTLTISLEMDDISFQSNDEFFDSLKIPLTVTEPF